MKSLQTLVNNTKQLLHQGYYQPVVRRESKISLVEQLEKEFTVIVEIKPGSPTNGRMIPTQEIYQRICKLAMTSQALSVLTEPNYFFGSIEHLRYASKFNIPILMKDIIINEAQIRSGNDATAVLLIKRILAEERLEELIDFAHKQGLEVVLEVDNSIDFGKAINFDADILAINNRDLGTMRVNIETSLNILSEFDIEKPVLALSGYERVSQLIEVRNAGASGVLIGSWVSKYHTPDRLVRMIREGLNGSA